MGGREGEEDGRKGVRVTVHCAVLKSLLTIRKNVCFSEHLHTQNKRLTFIIQTTYHCFSLMTADTSFLFQEGLSASVLS